MPRLQVGKFYLTKFYEKWIITAQCNKDPLYPYVGYRVYEEPVELHHLEERPFVEEELVPHFFNEKGEHYYDFTNNLIREIKILTCGS